MKHQFKPYAEYATLCVAELDNGDTCNQPEEAHEVSLSEVFEIAAELRAIDAKFDAWIEKSQDEHGEWLIDDEDYYDGKAEWYEALGEAGLRLAAAVERLKELPVGVPE